MTNANKIIKISSILYLISSLLTIHYLTPIGAIFLIIGLLLLAYSFLLPEDLKRKKLSLIIIAILSCLLNIPSAILLFIAVNEISSVKQINNNSPPIIEATSENKRIDLLLKLGLSMILISGVLFATTSWEIISNFIKVVALVLMGLIFLGLSSFSEKKLKISSTTKAYFILGLAFFLLTWIGIGYFGTFSQWFSFSGAGKNLVYFITFILLSLMLYIIANKFQEKEYAYIGHSTLYIALYHLLTYANLDLLTTTLVLTTLSLVINLLPNTEKLTKIKEVNSTISYLYWPLILTQCFNTSEILVLIVSLINICNMLLLLVKNKNTSENIFGLIISYLLILISVLKLSLPIDKVFVLFAVISLFSLLIKYQKLNQNKPLIITNQILFNVFATIIIIVLATYTPLYLLIASLIYIIINIINSLNTEINEIDFRYQPIVIFIAYMSIIHFININVYYIGELLAFALTALSYAIIKHFSKTEKITKYYNVFLIIAMIFTYLLNFNYLEIAPAIILLSLSIYSFIKSKNPSTSHVVFYIFILTNIVSFIESLGLYDIASTMNSLIILSIFIILTLTIKDSKLSIINYIAIAFPLYSLVNSFSVDHTLNTIINNLFYIYLLFLVLKLIIKDKRTKDIVGTVGLILIVLDIITTVDLLIGLYIGILGIIIIFITFNEEEYKKMFYCGVVITILNIIIQLWELWARIPFWLYLLIVGIAIIAFVTYKEMYKKDEPNQLEELVKKSEVPEQEIVSVPLTTKSKQNTPIENIQTPEKIPVAKFCPACGTQNMEGNFCRNCGKDLKLK